MRDPIGVLAASVHHAVLVGLKPELYEIYRYEGTERVATGEMGEKRRHVNDVECTMFSQTWGSTALGFGGIGGQAMTDAYTVVVYGPMGDVCVYFGGRFAYHIERPNDVFREDVRDNRMFTVAGAAARYESQP